MVKFIHLSDLHLGKIVNGFSMLEDQEYILEQILGIIRREDPDGILLGGDCYDRAVPPAAAVRLFDEFLSALQAGGREVFVISGNHDSPERIAFGSRIMDGSGIHMSPVYNGNIQPFTIHGGEEDKGGSGDEIRVYLLPFIKPVHVRAAFPEEELSDYTDALRIAIEKMDVDPARMNVLLAHQFVTGAVRTESEEISVGGLDNVDASVFAPFDYVALGHLHGPQNVGGTGCGAADAGTGNSPGPVIRYCGSPLKYSFSEADQEKSVTVVTLHGKGNIEINTIPLQPRRDLKEIRGSYMEVTARDFYENFDREAYLHVTLTDEQDITDGVRRLQTVYPNLMKMDYDNSRTRNRAELESTAEDTGRSPMELFGRLYETQNNQPMSEEQKALLQGMIEKIWGGEEE